MGAMPRDFDIVIVGGGHAGAEAAWAAARMGLRAALVTLRPRTIGQMSCNPAIGGVGKGQIVREIDALGGLMGLAADATGIQFRMLNLGKGPAVWGPRCQSDRHAYAAFVQRALTGLEGLTILAGEATEVLVQDGCVRGVRFIPATRGEEDSPDSEGAPLEDELRRGASGASAGAGGRAETIACGAVVVTAGTFLNGAMHLGERTWTGGRYGEPAAAGLTASLRALGVESARLKTGTCPRVAAGTIDYSRCRRQDGDDPPRLFSFLHDRLDVRQVPCWLTDTTPEIHDAVRANLHRAPLYTGQITAAGPRYCPSFETKVVRFADKSSHQIFLEPEGRDTDWVYLNGLSTSLPPDVQDHIVHLVPGLENARVLRWGYAIEYDYFPPTQLTATLQTKTVRGLYLAGQVNGTTGYEEAGALGLLAAVNAALQLQGREALVLRRDQAYIGVMIDDLVTKGVSEPYRMFTSRAECRLTLRADNADRRLTDLGRQVGLADDARWAIHQARQQTVGRAEQLLRGTRLDGKSLWDLLQRPDAPLEALLARAGDAGRELAALRQAQPDAVESLCIDARYAGYVAREAGAIRQMQQLDAHLLPERIDYAAVPQLRHEARERLAQVRPRSLGQALRISGITPADITVLTIYLAGRSAERPQGNEGGC